MSAQEHVGTLDHVISSLPATITSRFDITFPSDHIPQLASFQSPRPASPLPSIHSKGWYLLPKTPGARTVPQFREIFGTLQPLWRTQSLGCAIRSFSKAILHAVQTVAGPPATYLDTPNALVQIQQHLNHKLGQYPHWWTHPSQVKDVSSLRAKVRAAWEIAEVSRALQIAPATSLCVSGAPAPSKK